MNHPSHIGDAGHDLIAATDPFIAGTKIGDNRYLSIQYVEYNVNIRIAPQKGVFALVYPRSSISSNTNLILANSVGVIDNGYRNIIKLRFRYNFQPVDLVIEEGRVSGRPDRDRMYNKGDRIGQLVFCEHLPTDLVEYEGLPKSERGLGGFGSTGR